MEKILLRKVPISGLGIKTTKLKRRFLMVVRVSLQGEDATNLPLYALVMCPKHGYLTSHMDGDCTVEPCWDQLRDKIRLDLMRVGELRGQGGKSHGGG